MTEPKHGEPGHVCHRAEIDATDALAGVIIRQHPDQEDALTADAWSHGLTKRAAASILKDLAAEWDKDADAEDAEEAAMARARKADLN
jgi:hypothetical protein